MSRLKNNAHVIVTREPNTDSTCSHQSVLGKLLLKSHLIMLQVNLNNSNSNRIQVTYYYLYQVTLLSLGHEVTN